MRHFRLYITDKRIFKISSMIDFKEIHIMKQILCPISHEKISEQVTRLNALLGILLAVAGFATNSVLFFIFLLADFYIRAFTKAKFSPISYLSHRMANALNLNKKSIDKAPKIFAARIGLLMTLAITILTLLNFNIAALAVGGILVFFASLQFAWAVLCTRTLYFRFINKYNFTSRKALIFRCFLK